MTTPQASQESSPEVSQEAFGQLSTPSPELAFLTALCLAAGRNGQAPDVRAKEALILARAVRAAVDGDDAPPPAAADGPVLERGTIGASMLQRQVGEMSTKLSQLQEALDLRNAEAQSAHEKVVALEAELRQAKDELAAAKAATSTGTSGPAPKPPKGKPSESKTEE